MNEFQTYIKGIYGDATLDLKTMAQLWNVWKTNPQAIINAYNLKNQPKKAEYLTLKLKFNTEMPSTLINLSNKREDDDLSGVTNFLDAFKVARLKGLKQFKWRSTKANPSGMFGTLLASSILKPTLKSILKPTSDKDSESSTKSNTVETMGTAIKEPRRSFFEPNIENYDKAIDSDWIVAIIPLNLSFLNWSKLQAYLRGVYTDWYNNRPLPQNNYRRGYSTVFNPGFF